MVIQLLNFGGKDNSHRLFEAVRTARRYNGHEFCYHRFRLIADEVSTVLSECGPADIVIFSLGYGPVKPLFQQILSLVNKIKTPQPKIIVDPIIDSAYFASKDYERAVGSLAAKGIFVIYPDLQVFQKRLVSAAKLSDTVVCHTHRPKFKTIRLQKERNTTELEEMSNKYIEYFISTCRNIIDNGLYTDTYDGTLSMRTPKGYLTLATKTNKAEVRDSDLVLVKNYDTATNTVYCVGSKYPSSDVPCDTVLYSAFGDTNAMVHTHCKRLTYAEELGKFVTRSYVPYGTVELGHEIVEKLRDSGERDFVVLSGHGEYSLSSKGLEVGVSRLLEISSQLPR